MSPQPPPAWERRFRAPTVTLPTWSRHAPDRLVFATNEAGSWQVYAWDRSTGTRRKVTEDPIGVPDGAPTADGEGVLWFHDEKGDEFGRYLVQPFAGGAARPLLPGVPDGWPSGLALGRSVSAVGLGLRERFAVWLVPEGGEPRELVRHDERLEIGGGERAGFNLGGLSADERLVCVVHCEHGDNLHPALRVHDVATGEIVGQQWDGPGLGLTAWSWSPVPGDQRLAIVHEREDRDRPAIWDLSTGERTDLALDLPGSVVEVFDWWPDGSALLVNHTHDGRDRLYRYEIRSGGLDPVDHPEGALADARVRPDGEVWFRMSSGAWQARALSSRGVEVLAPEAERAPDGRPYTSWGYRNARRQRVHGFVVSPEGEGPFPTVLEIHGGPHWLWLDQFSPLVQAWVDHGFAVALVNYRGSIGYGRSWRDEIIGNPGFTELEDLVVGVDDLVTRGTADPERLVCSGESWGGYLTLLALSLHPDRWAAGVAGVPVADYPSAYEDEAPALQAMDRGLFGGSPLELAAMYHERSPSTYVDRVKAPVLILAGENDSRCPIRQIDAYVEMLRARGGDVEVYRYTAGHSSFLVDERVRQMRAKLDFVLRHVRGWGWAQSPAT